jgi:hypothetical protein
MRQHEKEPGRFEVHAKEQRSRNGLASISDSTANGFGKHGESILHMTVLSNLVTAAQRIRKTYNSLAQ